MDKQENQTTLTSAAFMRVLRRRYRLIAVCALTVFIVAVAFSLLRTNQYSATASLLFRDPALDTRLFGGGDLDSSSDPFRAAATNLQLVSLDVVSDRTAEELGDISGAEVRAKTEIAEQGQSDLISITATDSDAERAAEIANTFALEFIDFRREADRAKIDDAAAVVKGQLDELEKTPGPDPDEGSLRARLDQLIVLASLQTGNAELAQPAEEPEDPSSPGPLWSGFLGLLLGTVLGTVLALLFDRFDRRIRDPRELEEAFGRPILASIPEGGLPAGGSGGTSVEGTFRSLAASLRFFAVNRSIKTIAVASAAPGEGKSSVARALATALAGSGRRTLLLEADLRHGPAVLPAPGAAGLSDTLATGTAWESAVTRAEPAAPFDTLPAGAAAPNPEELLASDAMSETLRAVSSVYDAVVLDMPDTTSGADAIPLLTQVDGVLVVVREGHSTREAVENMRLRMERLAAPVLGIVYNSASAGDTPLDGGNGRTDQSESAEDVASVR